MQTLRDAIVLVVIMLVFGTVRVSPLPEVRLSPAQAGQTALLASPAEFHNASGTPAQADAPTPAAAAAGSGEAQTDEARTAGAAQDGQDRKAPCSGTLAVESRPRVCPKRIEAPCDA